MVSATAEMAAVVLSRPRQLSPSAWALVSRSTNAAVSAPLASRNASTASPPLGAVAGRGSGRRGNRMTLSVRPSGSKPVRGCAGLDGWSIIRCLRGAIVAFAIRPALLHNDDHVKLSWFGSRADDDPQSRGAVCAALDRPDRRQPARRLAERGD